jgi:hypothetical protein
MLTAARLREVLSYDPETGVFTRRHTTGRCGRWKAGSVAGSKHAKGYWAIRIDGRLYLAQRLAWLYVHGRWPVGDTDHRDRDKLNNAIANLREATRAQNMANAGAYVTNTLGVRGVDFMPKKGKFRARFNRVHLGLFETLEAAKAARLAAALAAHGEFAGA